MKAKIEHADVGIIVGRFQTPWLHDGHKELIKKVQDFHQKTIIFLGVSPLRNTTKNPLDVRARRAMIAEDYPDIDVYYVEDEPDDITWSKKLDLEISKHLKPTQSCMLYGSRDSFLDVYHGKYKTTELESESYFSATEIRKQVRNSFKPTREYRAGMTAATAERWPTAFQTVDVAIVKYVATPMPGGLMGALDGSTDRPTALLLGRKSYQKEFRFIGGYSDPTSESLEIDARREVYEETGLSVGGIRYLFSTLVDDWKYANEQDKIKTAFFISTYQHGRAEAKDDIEEVKWFDLDKITEADIVKEHKPLFRKFMTYLYPQEAN